MLRQGWCFEKPPPCLVFASSAFIRMASEAASILADLHRQLLRELSRTTGRHFQGLRSAAAHLRREGLITNKLTKKLARIDDACALNMHVTLISAASVMEEFGMCLEPTQLPTEVLPNCNSGNQKDWHHAAEGRPNEVTGNLDGNFDGTSFQHVHNNFHGTFHGDCHNKVHSSVIPGMRLPVPRRQQREETSEPRLSSNNGTNHQGRRGSTQGYQKVIWADDIELSPPTQIRGYYQ